MEAEPVVGAFDLGSNSFHLVVARVRRDRSFDELLSEKVMLRLGEDVAKTGRFSLEAINRAVEEVVRLKAEAELVGCTEFVANATAAFREAENAQELVEEIFNACNLEVHVISGHQEAELIFRAVRSAVHIGRSPALVTDMGGGSLELALGDQSQMYFGVSVRVGVGRLMSRFSHQDPMTNKEIDKIERYLDQYLDAPLSKAEGFAPKSLVVSSGTFSNLVGVCYQNLRRRRRDPLKKSLGGITVGSEEFVILDDLILNRSAEERLRVPGVDPKRNDQLPVGYLALRKILSKLPRVPVQVSGWALREGMILEYVEGLKDFEFSFKEEELRRGSIEAVVQRFGGVNQHSEQVANFAKQLGETLKDVLELDLTDIELLEFAGFLHDVGDYISLDNHDKHSAYLVETANLKGFTASERSLLACLCRYHKKGNPKKEQYEPLTMLSREHESKLPAMIGIVRLADSLDRSHQSYVESINVQIDETRLLLEINTSNDVTLELYGIRKKMEMLESVLERRIDCVVR